MTWFWGCVVNKQTDCDSQAWGKCLHNMSKENIHNFLSNRHKYIYFENMSLCFSPFVH